MVERFRPADVPEPSMFSRFRRPATPETGSIVSGSVQPAGVSSLSDAPRYVRDKYLAGERLTRVSPDRTVSDGGATDFSESFQIGSY